jgi:5'-nucleotidase
MKILITNDDGIDALGLAAAVASLDGHEVMVVAPREEQSAMSARLTLRKPIGYRKVAMQGTTAAYSCDGSPVDCAKFALGHLCETPPDLVLSGFNLGLNVGYDVFYSGTIAAAMEGVFLGIPSLAVSLERPFAESMGLAIRIMPRIAAIAAGWQGAGKLLLSANIPAAHDGPMVISRQGCAAYRYWYVKEKEGDGESSFWLRGEYIAGERHPDADAHVVGAGCVSISLLRPSFCSYNYDNRRLLADICERIAANGVTAR